MNHEWNSLLLRQLKKSGLPKPDESDSNLLDFIQKVDNSYKDANDTRKQLERSLQISSDEMQSLYSTLESYNETLESQIKQRTKELDEAEKLFRSLSESSPVGIVKFDNKGKCIYVNENFLEIFEYSQKEALEEESLERLFASDRGPSSLKKFNTINIREDTSIQYEICTPSGKRKWINARSKSVIDESGKIIAHVGTIADISEEKKYEQLLQIAKEDAEAASKTKSEFLANMSHEIRTPLNGVVGMINLLQYTNLSDQQKDYIEILRTSSDSLLDIINDILDFSKIEAGKLDIEYTTFNLQALILETLETFLPDAEKKGLEIILRYEPNSPKWFLGDYNRIKQILMNIVNNAIKFTIEGHVLVDVEYKDTFNKKMFIQISVKDTGIGISKNNISKIFDQFSQADSSTTRKYGGTGLGLAISKQLVELMGGNIQIKSDEGEGSTFTFVLPLMVGEEKDSQFLPEKSYSPLKNIRILIVDDNKININIIEEYLGKWGVICCSVNSGKKALHELQTANKSGKPFKFILLDYLMPEMNGLTLAKKIKNNFNISETILIMLTSATALINIQEIAGTGILAYLTKPINESNLLNMLASFCNNKNKNAKFDIFKKTHIETEKNTGLIEIIKAKNLRVLLVEDNITNQKSQKWLLEKFGCIVDIASNGKESIQMVNKFDYNIIFMDLQMPEMDGYKATELIRKEENNSTHIPIIAMTANAMTGDREKCIETGMDDYLSKPVNNDELLKKLYMWSNSAHNEKNNGGKKISDPSKETSRIVFDYKNALEIYENDYEILKEIISCYLEDVPVNLENLKKAFEIKDHSTLNHIAHSLKGGASYIGAEQVRMIALKIEKKAKINDLNHINELIKKLGVEIKLFENEYQTFMINK
ncbi:MAG: response regulator [Pseudomonadota bacterium]